MKLLCLANSRKNMHRCIAGMTADGVWIRPVSNLPDGSITRDMRQIDGREPKLLDVLGIPLAENGPDFGHQPENRLVLQGAWERTGKLAIANVRHFCETRDVLLHTATDRVPATMIAGMPQADRYSLQLIEVTDARFHQTVNFRGNPQYRARFTYSGEEYDIVVTDPVAEERLAKNDTLNANCILTLSMGGPYDANYYKFLAAVIEPND